MLVRVSPARPSASVRSPSCRIGASSRMASRRLEDVGQNLILDPDQPAASSAMWMSDAATAATAWPW